MKKIIDILHKVLPCFLFSELGCQCVDLGYHGGGSRYWDEHICRVCKKITWTRAD